MQWANDGKLMAWLGDAELAGELVWPEGNRRTRRAAAVVHRAVMNIQSLQSEAAGPTMKAIELVMSARCSRVADNADVMTTLSGFLDCSADWTIVMAAEAELWILVKRIALRESYDGVDPLYRQWVYTRTMAMAAHAGRLDMIQFLTARFPGCYVTFAVDEAARNGHLEILQWLHHHHDNVKWGAGELTIAMRCNHFEVAQWIYNNVPGAADYFWDVEKVAAAESGDLRMLKWALSRSRADPLLSLTEYAVQSVHGNLEIIKWLVENGYHDQPPSVNVELDGAAERGQLDVIQYLTAREIGYCSPRSIERAGVNGHFETVKWILQNRTDGRRGASFNEIAAHGRVEIVRWIAQFYPDGFDEIAMVQAARNGHLDVIICLDDVFGSSMCTLEAMNAAAGSGHLEIVKWLHTNRNDGCTTTAMDEAAANGHLETVKWLHANRQEGCTIYAMDKAASGGHLDVAMWLHENRDEGCSVWAANEAAKNGHLNVIKWLHETQPDVWTANAIDFAATNGYLNIIKWLHKNRSEGCTNDAMDRATRGGHVEVLKWLHEHYDVLRLTDESLSALDMAAAKSHLETLRWLNATYDLRCTPQAMPHAILHGYFDTVIVLRSEFGCGCVRKAFVTAFKSNELEILQWLFRHFPDDAVRDRNLFGFTSSDHLNKWLYQESEELLPR